MKKRLSDRVTFTRYTTSQDEFGDNQVDSTTTIGTFWANVDRPSADIRQKDNLENQLVTDYEMYFRKKSVSSILKGDIATLEDGSISIKINSIVEYDWQTIKMTGSSVA